MDAAHAALHGPGDGESPGEDVGMSGESSLSAGRRYGSTCCGRLYDETCGGTSSRRAGHSAVAFLVKCLHQAGAFVQAHCDASRTSEFCCGICQTRFGSLQQWAVHAFKRHPIVKPTPVLAPGSQCPACLKQYVLNIALRNHLNRSERSRIRLVRAGFHHDPQPGQLLGRCQARLWSRPTGGARPVWTGACGPTVLHASFLRLLSTLRGSRPQLQHSVRSLGTKLMICLFRRQPCTESH